MRYENSARSSCHVVHAPAAAGQHAGGLGSRLKQQLSAGRLDALTCICQGQCQQTTNRLYARLRMDADLPSADVRVFCVSDLHVDQHGGANMAWVSDISSSKFKADVLIVAGETCCVL